MSKQKTIWECAECGYTQSRWSGNCYACKGWNTFIEQIAINEKSKRFSSKKEEITKPICLRDIDCSNFSRIKTKMTEFDRLCGGGIVEGSLILLGGEPGIGKSTLLLQIANALASMDKKVLYICAEESEQQTSLRARRLGIDSENLFLYNETLFQSIKLQIDQLKPDIIIVDSIQIIYKNELPSSPGSVVQVREIANEFLHISKGYGITTFLVGHITKSGELAGPRLLEHLVDTVFDFEGEKHYGFRLLRVRKNRFGPTDDIALYRMNEEGLHQVLHPSIAFLEKRRFSLSGITIVPTIEMARAMLIEVQALVSHSAFSTPSRKAAGLDSNRLSLLLAVLEKRLGYQLYTYDVYVSLAGGIRIKETGIDLGVILSIASSVANEIIDENMICFGEVGLAGEIRNVSHAENRVKEAINMGFTKCMLPENSIKSISKTISDQIELIPVNLVDEAIRKII